MSEKAHKIRNLDDWKAVREKILGDLLHGKAAYFGLLVWEGDTATSCFFSPAVTGRGDKGMVFVGDYERIVRLLLSHPKVKDMEYNRKERMISAVFEDPYWAEEEKRCQYYAGDEISARDVLEDPL